VPPLITAPEIGTDLLWKLSGFFVALGLLYFISVFFFRNKIAANSARISQRRNELSPMISEFLFYEESVDREEKSNYIALKIKIRDLLREDLNRRILAQILLDLRKDVSGDTQKKLFRLYSDLGLEKDAFKKLQSWRWEVVAKGILELTQMQVEEAYPFIVKFINHRRGTVRKQAEIAIITLKPSGISHFLDTTQYKISEWQQLKLLDVLRNKEGFEPPRFKAWLTSTNIHVVLFALRLIKYYNQNDSSAPLIELIKHKDRQVRQQAIGCIKDFHITDALPTLKGVFSKCTGDTKLDILDAIAELGDASDIEFLEYVTQREGNFSVKSKAVGAINTIAPGSIMPTENIEPIKPYKTPGVVERSSLTPINTPPSTNQSVPLPNLETPPPVEAAAPAVNEQSNNVTLENPTPMTESKEPQKPIKDIEVVFERVDAESHDVTSTRESSRFDICEIDFLPIVVAAVTEMPSEETDIPSGEMEATFDKAKPASDGMTPDGKKASGTTGRPPKESGDSISPNPMEEELHALISEINELDFLPLVIDKDQGASNDESDGRNKQESNDPTESYFPNESDTLDDIEGYSLSDFEVSFEAKNSDRDSENEMDMEFDLKEDPLYDPEHGSVEDVISWLLSDNELREIELEYEIVSYPSDIEVTDQLIPEPIYYDEHEAYMMGLLDDLEELGDHREIPLLQELKAEESKGFIRDRIATMMAKFNGERDNKKKAKPVDDSADLPVFSVFADLFKDLDTDCKLILLDEIIHVGDEKEIEFLDGLLEDGYPRIRSKAKIVLELLIEKLSREKPKACYTKGVRDVFAKHGALDQSNQEEKSNRWNQPAQSNDPIFGKAPVDVLLSGSNMSSAPDFLNIGFELNEVDAEKHNLYLQDIPVIVTEVSAHKEGRSFLDQMRNFTKLFF